MANSNAVYNFGPLRLDTRARRLLRNNAPVSLTPKCFDLLQILVENHDRALSKSELMAALWPDAEVEDGNLAFQISALRKALGPEVGKWIETIPRHGYRFCGQVVEMPVAQQDLAVRAPKRRWFALLLAGLFALTIVIVVIASVRRRPSNPTYAAPLPLTTFKGDELAPAWAPTGKEVAFVWNGPGGDNWDIYVKQDGVEQPVRMTTDSKPDMNPAWSPDGRRIAFGRQIATDSVDIVVKPYPDGPERRVAQARACFMFTSHVDKILDWHADGEHLIVSGLEERCGLSTLSIATGAVTPLTAAPSQSAMDLAPAVCAGGRTVAFMRGSTWPNFVVYTVALSPDFKAAAAPERLTSDARSGMWPDWTQNCAEVVFSSLSSGVTGALFRVPVSGPRNASKISGLDATAMYPAVSQDGSIAYSTRPPFATNIHRLDVRSGSTAAFAPSTYLQQSPVYSPDGTRVAFESERSGYREIWVSSADGSQLRQLTHFNGPTVQSPSWSFDASRILFTAAVNGERSVYSIPSTGGTPQRLTVPGADHPAGFLTRDGKWLYLGSNRSGEYQIWKVPVGGGAGEQITSNGGMNPRVSPDGRYIYHVTRGTQTTLWRLPVAGGPAVRLTNDLYHLVGLHPTNDGAYYVARPAKPGRLEEFRIRFVEGKTGLSRDVASVGGPLGWGLSVSPDRKTLLFVRNVPGTFDLKVVRPAAE